MLEMMNWTICRKGIEDFRRETQELHDEAPETIYQVRKDEEPTSREEFIRQVSEICENNQPGLEIWAAAEYMGGGPMLFECWTMEVQRDNPHECRRNHQTQDNLAELPF